MDSPDSPIDFSTLNLGLEDNNNNDSYEENSLLLSDLLGRELSVKVNGNTWDKILVDMNERGEEAVIVLYGLLPGRHYEIELTVLNSKETVKKHVVTDLESAGGSPVSDHYPDLPGAMNNDTATSTTISLPVPTTPSQAPQPPRTITIEERAAQLRHNLSLLTTEKETLTAQLKNSRKESQRAEASLRSEMDALKRASDKQAATEHRTRQKVLALQEAVKQGYAAALECDNHAEQLKASMPALEQELEDVEREHAELHEVTNLAQTHTEELLLSDRKRISELHAELSSLTHKLERLNVKKDRLENETIKDIEMDLRILQAEYDELERQEYMEREKYGVLDISNMLNSSSLPLTPSHSSRMPPISRPSYPPLGDGVNQPQRRGIIDLGVGAIASRAM